MNEYGYARALKEAGAKVIVSEEFGSYQGDFWAKVEYEGKTGWVNIGFGSCSYCDTLEAELDQYRYDDKKGIAEAYKRVGLDMLEKIYTQEEAEAQAQRYDWDMEADSIVAFMKKNA